MSVILRERKRQNKTVLFLDINHEGKRQAKYLKIYLTGDREQDKVKRKLAEQLRNAEERSLLSKAHGVPILSSIEVLELLTSLANRKANSNWFALCTHWRGFRPKKFPLNAITESVCQNFQSYLQAKMQNNSARVYMQKFGAAMNYAVRSGYIAANPTKNLDRISPVGTKRDFLTTEELSRFISAKYTPDKRTTSKTLSVDNLNEIRDAFLFSCFTGLRYSDIALLQSKDFQNGVVQIIQKKTGDTITIPLHPVALKVLEKRLERSGATFRLASHQTVWRWLKRWQKAAGITKSISFHTARHTFAMLALKSSKDIYSVSKLLGHKDIKTTEIYLKILDESKQKTIDSMPSIDFPDTMS